MSKWSMIHRLLKNSQKPFVILSGAKNLSWVQVLEKKERFFAPLRMTKTF
jgi:hypothetical protein